MTGLGNAVAAVFGFQILIDGRLIKHDSASFSYDDHQLVGLWFPFDIPAEGFLFGIALLSGVILARERQRQ
jgi:lycopene cyclase domain-containing protein